MPHVTVIIATYNSSRTLHFALRSLRRQTFDDFEAWIVGDACTDNSEEVVEAFGDPRLRWANLRQHSGCQSRPNNEGLRRAHGRYIAYLGHDDLWFPWHLAGLVSAIEKEGADFVHAAAALIDRTGPVGVIGSAGVNRSYAQRFIAPSTWLHRREIVKSGSAWPDPKGQIGGVDFVFHRRASLAGHRFAACPQLSVVKFPSTWWEAYALTEGHPQPAYMDCMEQDPVQFHQQLLTELTFAMARPQEDALVSQGLAITTSAMKARIQDWYGRDRWPLAQYLAWRGENWRRRALVLRGLSKDNPQSQTSEEHSGPAPAATSCTDASVSS